MIIKRDILGTIVNIELTEQELTNAHIAYLEQEIKALKAGAKEEPIEIMPSNLESKMKPIQYYDVQTASILTKTEPSYINKLRECSAALRSVGKYDTKARGKILDQYEDYLYQAKVNGMTFRQINAMVDVSNYILRDRINRVRYIKTHAA